MISSAFWEFWDVGPYFLGRGWGFFSNQIDWSLGRAGRGGPNETQGKRQQKFKTGVSVAPQKGLVSSKYFEKKLHV